MLEVKQDPGLQSVASATVTPAASSRRASGYGCRVENSTPGSNVATVPENPVPGNPVPDDPVPDAARASTSASLR